MSVPLLHSKSVKLRSRDLKKSFSLNPNRVRPFYRRLPAEIPRR